MLWNCDLDTNTNSRADAKQVWKENITRNIRPNTRRGNAGFPDETVNSTVYTMNQTLWRTLKLND